MTAVVVCNKSNYYYDCSLFMTFDSFNTKIKASSNTANLFFNVNFEIQAITGLAQFKVRVRNFLGQIGACTATTQNKW
jgi:hypothetical protein